MLSACPSYDARIVVPESIKEVNKVGIAGKPKPVDILFVVDNSGSMADEQEKLAVNFRAFIEVLSQSKDADYQLAVVTTDLLSNNPLGGGSYGPESEGLVMSTYEGPPYYSPTGGSDTCRQLTDIRHGCFRGPSGKRVISSSLSAEEQISQFAENVRVGSCGSGTEKGLEAMLVSLEQPCNAGFIREGANLVVVFVTDENDEGSPPDLNYSQALLDVSGKTANEVRVAVIAGSVGGRASYCGKDGTANCGMAVDMLGEPPMSDVRHHEYWNAYDDGRWCSYFNAPDCCPARPGERYIAFAQALEEVVRSADTSIENVDCVSPGNQRVACLIDSICQNDFSETLRRIAKDLVITTEYGLSPPASYVPGVVVEINGTRLVNCATVPMGDTCGFTVTPNGSSLSLNTPPAEGDDVQIYFTVSE